MLLLLRYSIMSTQQNLHFILGDKLPTIYDAAISIFSVATQPDTNKM